MAKDYPVGKAQQMVLDALGIKASGYSEAERIFSDLGIKVTSKRVGRSSVPVVTDDRGGAFNADGEGETWGGANAEVLAKVKQWME